MTVYRYETIEAGHTDSVNRLLTRGWRPLREIPTSDASAVTVLLAKDADVEPFALDELAPGVPVSFLESVSLFDGLTPADLRQTVSACELIHVRANDEVFSTGDEDRALYIILEGEVDLGLPPLSGEDTQIMQAGPGEVFGESSFFSSLPHAATATAISDARMLRLSREKYDELMQHGHSAAWQIALNAATILASRLNETDAWVHELLEQEQDARIAASWRSFRESLGRSTYVQGGLFRL